MNRNEHFIEQWEQIIKTVDKTIVPVHCIKRIILKLSNGRRKTINLTKYKKNGLGEQEIELAIADVMQEFEDQICDIDFFVDVEAVANMVQTETDKLLGKLV